MAREATAALAAAGDAAALEAARIQFLGAKSGRLKAVQKGLGLVDKAESRPPANGSMRSSSRSSRPTKRPSAAGWRGGPAAAAQQFDPTVPGIRPRLGHLHPVTQTIRRVEGDHGPAGIHRGRRAGGGGPLAQFRGAEHPAGASGPRPLENFYLAARESESREAGRKRDQRSLDPAPHKSDLSPPRRLRPFCCAARRARCRFG